MNHSLLSADPTTHLKIASVALLGVIIVVAIGITARLAGAMPGAGAIKAGAPAIYSRSQTPPAANRPSPHGDWLANPGGVVSMSLPA